MLQRERERVMHQGKGIAKLDTPNTGQQESHFLKRLQVSQRGKPLPLISLLSLKCIFLLNRSVTVINTPPPPAATQQLGAPSSNSHHFLQSILCICRQVPLKGQQTSDLLCILRVLESIFILSRKVENRSHLDSPEDLPLDI